MMLDLQEKLARSLATQALLAHRKDKDWRVLGDDVLRAALSGQSPLKRSEMAALLDSPMTLQRLKMLEAERMAAQQGETAPARTGTWRRSSGQLLAADSGAQAPALNTDDGLWRLCFLAAGDGYSMVLQLDTKRLEAASILAEATEIAVFDGSDMLVMSGMLDADGELEAAWPLATDSPYAHFMARGGRFSVSAV